VRKRFSDGRGAARVDKEGDINVSFPKAPDGPQHSTASALFGTAKGKDKAEDFQEPVEPQEDRHEAWRFLLAGGIAGAGESI
jgi:solute carrier family 25 phosphate transporter 23/24/25/41